MAWLEDLPDITKRLEAQIDKYIALSYHPKIKNNPEFEKFRNLELGFFTFMHEDFGKLLKNILNKYEDYLLNDLGVHPEKIDSYIPRIFPFNLKPEKPIEKMTLDDISKYLKNKLLPFMKKFIDEGWLLVLYDVYFKGKPDKLWEEYRDFFDNIDKNITETSEILEEYHDALSNLLKVKK